MMWCGLSLDTKTLNVKVDGSRYDSYSKSDYLTRRLTLMCPLELENTLTVYRGKSPGQGFKYRMLAFVFYLSILTQILTSSQAMSSKDPYNFC
jgi:hypothetical protein